MKNRFTFKTEKTTGRYKSFFPDTHYIKYKGHQVGGIMDAKPYQIRLMVIKEDIMEDGNTNCKWKNIFLAKKSESLDEAKLWLNENIEKILCKYELYMMED